MPQLFSNNARSTLTAPITSASLSLTVQAIDAPKFPSPGAGDFFDLTLQDATNIEIVRVTVRSAGVMTISLRGLEGTTAAAFATGAVAALRPTAAVTAVAMNHIPVAAGAHAASAISNAPAGNLVATEVQAALNELQTDVDTRATSAALTAHASAADPHPDYTTTAELNAGLATKQAADATLTALAAQVTAANNVQAYSGPDAPLLLSTGTASGNIPLIGTVSATETLAGLSRRGTTAEAQAGIEDTAPTTSLKTAQAIASIGLGGSAQSWQNMTSSRAITTTHTNSTGKPIEILVTVTIPSGGSGINLVVNSVALASWADNLTGTNMVITASAIIPNLATYSIAVSAGAPTMTNWWELR